VRPVGSILAAGDSQIVLRAATLLRRHSSKEGEMPKYLFQGSYNVEGVRGLSKEGGSSRRDHFAQNVANLGGKVESFYFAFGGSDVYAIAELPDNVSSAAISLALNAGGRFQVSTIVLLTPEEVDRAVEKIGVVAYRPPGQ
jgi:uncharacterized protein with GYD domain